jgi:hypothetical protein
MFCKDLGEAWVWLTPDITPELLQTIIPLSKPRKSQ